MKRNLTLSLAGALLVLLVAGCGASAAKPDSSGTITIDLTESAFTPDNIEVVAGTTVRFVIQNSGAEEHEFMVGRGVDRTPGYPDDVVEDFFHGLHVNVIGDSSVMVMGGESLLSLDGKMVMGDGMEGMKDGEGMEGMKDGEGMEGMKDGDDGHADEPATEDGHGEMAMEGDHSFMISQPAASGGTVIIVDIPADRVGTWEIACFVDEGTHYEDGMKGTLTVIAP